MASQPAPSETIITTSTSTTTTISITGTPSDIPIPSPIIKTPLFHIRPYHASDATTCTAAINSNSPLIAKYMRNIFPNPATLEGTEAWIQLCLSTTIPSSFSSVGDPTKTGGTLINYAIVSPDSSKNEFIGSIGFKPMSDIESRTFEIGYWVRFEYWGKGIMSAAVKEFTHWAFETFGELQRVEAQVLNDNEASVKVLTKAGFVYEGTRRKAGYKESLGGSFDIRMFGIVRDDIQGTKRDQAL
ncbi:putative acetyltransferase [Cladorrhinum sp. PSN259]|nr:putative acetyltransferase [Cladorrhinum sp. PSN259]